MSILPSSSLGEGNSVRSVLIGSVCSMSAKVNKSICTQRIFIILRWQDLSPAEESQAKNALS